MIGKKINQLATELAPASTDLTIIGNPTTGVSKKITLSQLGAIFSGAVSFYTNYASFPATGTLDVIFCAKDTQKLYLWSGSAYVEVFPSQALLDTYQLRSEKGNANGYASLDSTGKVPVSQLPSSIMEYKGTWSAATNTPTLANGTGDTGDVYICNAAGSVNFGAGAITFAVGDYVIYSGSIWQRSSGAVGTVTSVAASITGNAIGITGSPITTSGTLALAFAGTGAQYIKGDGTLATFPSTISQAEKLITEVYNSTGATLTKGTVVYINGGQGNLPTVTKALATGDSTSAQTFGIVQADITNMNNGYVVVAGKLSDLDTQAYAAGTQLYLSSTTAGAWTSTKQYAPAHLVYVGIVVRSHPTQGIVEVKIQNGYELDEIHNVAAQTPTNNDGLFWEASTSLWKNKSISTILGGTPITGSGNVNAIPKFTANSVLGNSVMEDDGNFVSMRGLKLNVVAGSGSSINFGQASSISAAGLGYSTIGASGTAGFIFYIDQNTTQRSFIIDVNNINSATTRNYSMPNASGTFALTSDLTGGTVTSVGLSSATSGVTIGSTPITTSGTITLAIATANGSQQGLLSSTDWTTFNNKQNALTNPVTGTGTINTIPKFTTTSGIGNSNLFDNGSTIYNNNPSAGQYAWQFNASTTSGQSFGVNILGGTTSADVALKILNSGGTGEFLRVTGDGNLLVGTSTNSTYKLDVSGAIRFAGSVTGTGNLSNFSVTATGGLARSKAITSTLTAAANNDVLVGMDINPTFTNGAFTGVTNYGLRVGGNSGLIYDQANQRLSIGTANTSFTIEVSVPTFNGRFVSSTGTNRSMLITGNTGGSLILGLENSTGLNYTGSSYAGVMWHTGNYILAFGNNNTERARFSATNGNFLINTTTDAGFRLDVNGTARITGNLTATSFIKSGGTSSQYLMADGSVSTLTNPVTGTGTTNYLPKFTGTSTIGDSIVQDASTYIDVAGYAFFRRGGKYLILNPNVSNANTYADIGVDVGMGITFTPNAGSAAMTLTTSGNLGLGNTPIDLYTGYKLQIGSSSDSQTFLSIGNSTTGLGPLNGLVIGNDSTGADIYQRENAPLRFHTNNTEVMRLNASGNLGLGTSSPIEKLTSNGLVAITGASVTSWYVGNNNAAFVDYNSGDMRIGSQSSAGSTTIQFYTTSSGYTGITEKMRLNASGNLGLGVTPSAWSVTALQVKSAAIFEYSNNNISFGSNIYFDGSNRYISSTSASNYQQTGGAHYWYTAPSGTAGNAISFTQAMTLNASGNLSIGNTNDTYKLDVSGTGRFSNNVLIEANQASSPLFYAKQTGTSGYTAIQFSGNNGTDIGALTTYNGQIYFGSWNGGNGSLGQLQINKTTGAATFSSSVTAGGNITGNGVTIGASDVRSSSNILTLGGTSEVIRISGSTGNVGIGTTSPSVALQVDASGGGIIRATRLGAGSAYIQLEADGTNGTLTSSAALLMNAGGSERMRITSGGTLLVGTTSILGGGGSEATNGLNITSNGLLVNNSSSDFNAYFAKRSGYTFGGILGFYVNGTQVGSISTNGTITSYNVSSDYRLKTDFKDYSGLELVNKIKTYDYEWKSDKSRGYGVIAHELQSVINYAVTGVKDGEQMQGVDYSKIVPVLIKAIQEQQQQIEQLKNK